jgi:putative nucleotidyltransferase with HDIG domain
VFAVLFISLGTPGGAAAALSGLFAGIASGSLRPGNRFMGQEGAFFLLSGLASIGVMALVSSIPGGIPGGWQNVALLLLLLVFVDSLISSLIGELPFRSIPGSFARYLLDYVIVLPVTVVLLQASESGEIGILAAVSIPLIVYSLLLDNREQLASKQREKTAELSSQNELVCELMSAVSSRDLVSLLSSYLSYSGSSKGIRILSRLPEEKGWMVCESDGQITVDSEELPGLLPLTGRLSEPFELLGRRGVFLGLSDDSGLLLFSDQECAGRLMGMSPEIRVNFVLLISQSWQAMGHHLRNEEAFLAAAVMLVRLVDSKDDYTHGHSLRVADLSCALGLRLGLPDDQMRTLRVGALLHDLGKIAIDTEILTKKGLLTASERGSMERHSEEGAAIVARLKGYDRVADIILNHHERLDGAGYPSGRKNREISFLARIVSVADNFDAITSTRSYHTLTDQMTALDTIRCGRGLQFDARVVDALQELISSRVQEAGMTDGT